jgi:Flp pilus assembly protein TadD
MARYAKPRAAAPKPPPSRRLRRTPKPTRPEDQLFFSRLRVHAKWIFVLLALVFGAGFIVYGVGTGSGGIGDLLNNNSSGGSSPSVKNAQKQVHNHPNDPTGYKKLATALIASNRGEEAVSPLERYLQLRPKDTDALSQLAGLYTARVTKIGNELYQAQISAQGTSLQNPFLDQTQPLGRALAQDAISDAAAAVTNVKQQEIGTRYSAAEAKVVDTSRRIALLSPDDPGAWTQLGQVAENARDYTTALGAYRQALKIEGPAGPDVDLLKAKIKQLQPTPAPAPKKKTSR